MNISDGEKIIILMMCDIQEKLDVFGEVDHKFIRSALLDNQIWGIYMKYPGLFQGRQDLPVIVQNVIRILNMWRVIERSYTSFSEAEKNNVLDRIKPSSEPRFQGFDGNNEADYLSTAIFLVEKLDRFQEFSGRDLNSHSSSLNVYDRMLEVFEERKGEGSMSVEDLVEVMLASRHPSFRDI